MTTFLLKCKWTVSRCSNDHKQIDNLSSSWTWFDYQSFDWSLDLSCVFFTTLSAHVFGHRTIDRLLSSSLATDFWTDCLTDQTLPWLNFRINAFGHWTNDWSMDWLLAFFWALLNPRVQSPNDRSIENWSFGNSKPKCFFLYHFNLNFNLLDSLWLCGLFSSLGVFINVMPWWWIISNICN